MRGVDSTRELLDSGTPFDEENTQVFVVQTVEQLQAAVDEGVEHIEVQQHMRLMELSLRDSANATQAVLVIPSTVKTLTGNCTTEIAQEYIAQFPATSPLLPLKPAQCLLLFTQSPLSVPPSANSDGELWLDNLYFRYIPPAGLGSTEAAEEDEKMPQVAVAQLRAAEAVSGSNSTRPLDSLWLTNVTVQGDSDRPLAGALIEGRVYAEDCVFSNLGPDVPNIQVAQDAASGAFHSCTFQYFLSNDSSVGILEGSGSSGLLVKASSFLENDVDALFVANDTAGTPLFYSDSSEEAVSAMRGSSTFPLPLSALNSSEIEFLEGDVGGSPTVAEQVERGSRVVRLISNDELGTMTVVAIVLSCVILFCCALVGLIAWCQRHVHDDGWNRYRFSKTSNSGPVGQQETHDHPTEKPTTPTPRRWRPNPVSESRGPWQAVHREIQGIAIPNPVFSPAVSPNKSDLDGSRTAPSRTAASAISAISTTRGQVSFKMNPYREHLESIGSLSVDLDKLADC